MSILSTLAKFVPVVGPALGDILGGQQKGAAQGAATQAQLQQGQDRNAIDLYGSQQGAQNTAADLDIKRKAYDAQSRSAAGKQALLAMLLQNPSAASVSVPGVTNAQISGGPAEMIRNNPQILELLKSIATKGTTDQATPNTFTGGNLIAPPRLTPLPQEGKGGKILDSIARIAQIAGGVGSVLPQKKTPQSSYIAGGYDSGTG